MKLLPAKKRKIAIIFAGGLGDTLLFVPLLKALNQKQFHITCIYYSRQQNQCLFDSSLFDEEITIRSKAGLLMFAIKHWKRFADFYINHLGRGNLVAVAGRICSTRITRTGVESPVEPGLSDAEQNLRLLYDTELSKINSIEQFYFDKPLLDRSVITAFVNEADEYFVVQVSSGNNTTPYKNWPINNWLELTRRL
ncbi:MAG TPA: hypothetical protein VKH37_04835, partial [Ferruginibacter sp.]|nr:hypothetical protein [Ferruginibacter sp.]